ncbi:MAG: CocE/NonD family hydrolase [Gaiellaceae bacterium]
MGRIGRACLVLLALALMGPSFARAADLYPKSFQPGPDQYPKISKQQDVGIVMRDGTKLYADVYRPADASGKPVPGRFPVVLTVTPYNKNSAETSNTPLAGYAPLLVHHGYVQVLVDARGTGSSEGEWNSFAPEEQRDSYDLARWSTSQPFSDGDLVTYGASYMAINQFLGAAQHPPGLKAMFTTIPMSDAYRDVTWHGGAIDVGFIPLWLGLVTTERDIPGTYTTSDPQEAAKVMASRISPGFRFPVTAVANAALGGDNSYDGEFYRVRSPETVVSQVHVPTFVTGGWYDIFQRGETRLYNELPLPPGRKQLLMGPWYHITTGQGLGQPDAPPPLDVLALNWFNRWVKGTRNGVENYGPVTVQQVGTTKHWEVYHQYPRHDVNYKRFYLGGGKSGSAGSINDGTLSASPPSGAGSDTMPANQANGVCTRASVQWTAGIVPPGQPCETDNRSMEATSLTYSTAPLKDPLHISGPLSLTLNGSTTAHDTTWIATVSDVSPSGQSDQITAGWLVQSYRALDSSKTVFAPNGDPIVPWHPFTHDTLMSVNPGEKDQMEIEIYATDAVLQPGHSLRVTISSGDVPHIMTTTPVTLNTVGAVNTVSREKGSPSFLTAGLAPLGPEPAAGASSRRAARHRAVRRHHRRRR